MSFVNKGRMLAEGDWVIVEKFEPDAATTSGGIIVNDSEDPDLGRVISVGPEVTGLKPDMVVAPDWSKAILVRHLTCAIRRCDVIAVVEEPSNIVVPNTQIVTMQ